MTYKQNPPVGGDHNPTWLNCGIYGQPVRNENAVHDLEHGAVWITYRPDLPQTQIDKLVGLVRRPDLRDAVALPGPARARRHQRVGPQLRLTGPDDPGLEGLHQEVQAGPQTARARRAVHRRHRDAGRMSRTTGQLEARAGDVVELAADEARAAAAAPLTLRWWVALSSVVGVAAVSALIAVLVVRPSTPGDDSAEAGFARDMQQHHAQAVDMAMTVRDLTDDPATRTLAYDITTTQRQQIGQMYGWLVSWGDSQARTGPPWGGWGTPGWP